MLLLILIVMVIVIWLCLRKRKKTVYAAEQTASNNSSEAFACPGKMLIDRKSENGITLIDARTGKAEATCQYLSYGDKERVCMFGNSYNKCPFAETELNYDNFNGSQRVEPAEIIGIAGIFCNGTSIAKNQYNYYLNALPKLPLLWDIQFNQNNFLHISQCVNDNNDILLYITVGYIIDFSKTDTDENMIDLNPNAQATADILSASAQLQLHSVYISDLQRHEKQKFDSDKPKIDFNLSKHTGSIRYDILVPGSVNDYGLKDVMIEIKTQRVSG